ncbi:hypothetical protein GGTG_01715 [Gaeumannomyces tritici R3-111a-1]|uniref:Uncharacterized protein n=1 Tax=Gaeumannomyces tritici (strain R3-111a-1) TaxID=644352 RepID=J3NKD6_GAET3|nr:hypothetical protein GGTG_01715 [Gaeumannomyces tritici R3-111a-1]EJT81740.1 hypothetical protein GGTG_01715 [Gaeumannomyces tritici R3-111a-1]
MMRPQPTSAYQVKGKHSPSVPSSGQSSRTAHGSAPPLLGLLIVSSLRAVLSGDGRFDDNGSEPYGL